MRTTSWPCSTSRPPTTPPMAPAPKTTNRTRERLYRRGRDVREELLEHADGDTPARGLVNAVEQLVQCLLRVAERALEVRVVAAPADIAPPHRGHRRDCAAVVLERRV